MTQLAKFYVKRKYCTGPLDFPCKTSEDAYELEALLKQAEKEGHSYQRLFISSDLETKAGGEGELRHTAVVTASTGDVDRDKEVVDVKGINLKAFRKNPVIAFGHDYTIPPVGRSMWEKVDGESLKAGIKFADRPSDWPQQAAWFPDMLFALAEQKILRGISIGYLELESSAPTEKEIKDKPSLAAARRICRKSMLLEISVVPIGCNPHSLIETVSKGLVDPEIAKHFGIELPNYNEPDLWVWKAEDFDREPEREATPEPAIILPSRLDVLKKLHANVLHKQGK